MLYERTRLLHFHCHNVVRLGPKEFDAPLQSHSRHDAPANAEQWTVADHAKLCLRIDAEHFCEGKDCEIRPSY